jgi:hypothetical protein
METLIASNARFHQEQSFIRKTAPAPAVIFMLIRGIPRTPEAFPRFIVAMILKESVIIGGAVAHLGICVREIIRTNITKISTFQASVNLAGLACSLGLGLRAGTMGAIYPVYKAAQVDPERALRFR